MYHCVPIIKYVNVSLTLGIHNGTDIPLGILANGELRELKKKAYMLFDPYWKEKNIKGQSVMKNCLIN